MRVITFTLISLLLSPALGRVRWVTPGAYRLWVRGFEDFPLDEAGTVDARGFYGRHRLRIDPTIEVGRLKVATQLDVLTGQIFGETSTLGAAFTERRQSDPTRAYDGWTTVLPRAFYLEWEGAWLSIQAGQIPARWGQGLVESDGGEPDDEGYWVRRFGGAWSGDLIDRLQINARPLAALSHDPLNAMVLSIGGDFIYQDEDADYLDGDEALQAHIGLAFPGEVGGWGLRVLRRDQEDADGDTLTRDTLSAHGHWRVPLYALHAALKVEGEAALNIARRPACALRAAPRAWISSSSAGWLAPRSRGVARAWPWPWRRATPRATRTLTTAQIIALSSIPITPWG
ncbi:hypothetical protein KKB55_10835 [Myxococcota bacterium]|nr:hypothetical protein [Myxococcota bacterium]